MAENVANKDEALKCLDIARAALKGGDHARAERFAAKALRLYRCDQTESMVLQVQIFISEFSTRGGAGGGSGGGGGGATSTSVSGDRRADHDQQRQQQEQRRQQQQQEQQQQQQHHHQEPRQQPGPRGMGGEGLRHRGHHGSGSGQRRAQQQQQQQQQQPPREQAEDPSVTPEQRKVVAQILAAGSFYDVLGVERGASDADIKSAYRKLALRLHPDKNKALKADEAFKLLSKAFSCLSNPDKRAFYDRTGYESTAAQAVAASASRRGGPMGPMGGGAGGFYYSGPDDFDPEEIFNMFFGAGAFHPHARVFRGHFGGHPGGRARAHAGSREEQQRGALMGLLQLLPVLLIVGLTLFAGSSEPAYSLQQDARYAAPVVTGRIGVKFFVKDAGEFEAKFPPNSHSRVMLERQVESEQYERVFQRCQNERMAQHRAFTWGNREAARRMELASCAEIARMNDAMSSYNSARQQPAFAA